LSYEEKLYASLANNPDDPQNQADILRRLLTMESQEKIIADIESRALQMRRYAIHMALNAGQRGVHLGPSFSIMDILATLYSSVLNHDPKNPRWPDRDRFILSKGHAALGLYTALATSGYFPPELLDNYILNESPLAGHPSLNLDLGIEASTGSLGHGLSIGIGMALAAKKNRQRYNTYVLVGDGESNEGTVWEAAMAASHFGLDNLVVIVDRNKLQADGYTRDIMDMGDVADKWRSFGWAVREVDGHNVAQLLDAFHQKSRPGRSPYAVIAHTTKGKGVSFFENNKAWHHYRGFSAEQAEMALKELDTCREREQHV
jgi:transketolase